MEQKSTYWKSAMTYGFYLGIVLVLYSAILYAIGQNLNNSLSMVSYVIMAGGIFYSQKIYRDMELGGYISYSRALGLGVAVMVFASVLLSLYSIILMRYIDPSILDQIRILQEEAMLERGVSEDQIEMMSEMLDITLKPIVLAISGLFAYALVGLFISLVTSIFVKREDDENAFDEVMDEVKPEE